MLQICYNVTDSSQSSIRTSAAGVSTTDHELGVLHSTYSVIKSLPFSFMSSWTSYVVPFTPRPHSCFSGGPRSRVLVTGFSRAVKEYRPHGLVSSFSTRSKDLPPSAKAISDPSAPTPSEGLCQWSNFLFVTLICIIALASNNLLDFSSVFFFYLE